MASFNDYYVDFDSGNNTTGDGSSGAPWLTLQHALTNGTLGTDGTRIFCEGTKDTEASTLTTTLTAVAAQPVWIIGQGYTGRAFPEVEVSSGTFSAGIGNQYWHWSNMHLTVGAARLAYGGNNYINCRLECGASDYALSAASVMFCECIGTYETGMSEGWRLTQSYGHAVGSYFEGYVRNSSDASLCQAEGSGTSFIGCVINLKSAIGRALSLSENGAKAINNTIIGTSGTGAGIYALANKYSLEAVNNIIVGFNGAGGIGIDFSVSDGTGLVASNAYYNVSTEDNLSSNYWGDIDNELTSVTPIAASGALSFDNMATYCAPVATGNVLSPTYGQYKGAIAPAASSGGGGAKIIGG